MNRERLEEILSRFPGLRVLALGDFFLDQYLIVEPKLREASLETGLEAHQVVALRSSPGAAGTVCSNLSALGIQVTALGIIGDDGNGYELLKGLESRGVDIRLMMRSAGRYTPAYIKPMRRMPEGAEEELERLDIKNRTPTPAPLRTELIGRLEKALPDVHGVIVGDQVSEEDCGVVTSEVRDELTRLSQLYPRKIFFVDSRARIGKFHGVIIKPNEREAADAVGDHARAETQAALFAITKKPVFLTRGGSGWDVFDGSAVSHCPAVRVAPPIDIVGAGDSASAGIVSALCAGATLEEAGRIGNLVASVTVRKIGTTGTASRDEVLNSFPG